MAALQAMLDVCQAVICTGHSPRSSPSPSAPRPGSATPSTRSTPSASRPTAWACWYTWTAPGANHVFAVLPPDVTRRLLKRFPFRVWNERTSEVRWVTAFDTTEEDGDTFAVAIGEELGAG
ncbi:hypothetical protein [Streptomyces sp. NBC_01788]|uniref:hypothetical protein n=1 Tax=Streptomyces sp. NBC_01788 TaxID=2975940 RepID=UPI003FA36F88